MLYQNDDFILARRRARICRWTVTLLVTASVVAGLIPMLASRDQLLAIVLSTAVALMLVFVYGTLLSPQISYQRFMRQAEEGIRRTFIGEFTGEGDESVRDGVRFVAMHFAVEQDEEPRRCYYDSSMLPHNLAEGRWYEITHTGNSILSIEPAEKPQAKGD